MYLVFTCSGGGCGASEFCSLVSYYRYSKPSQNTTRGGARRSSNASFPCDYARSRAAVVITTAFFAALRASGRYQAGCLRAPLLGARRRSDHRAGLSEHHSWARDAAAITASAALYNTEKKERCPSSPTSGSRAAL